MKKLSPSDRATLETVADRLGVRLVAAAGYDPKGGLKLFTRLTKLNAPPRQIDLGGYFSSHPSFEIRIRNINRLLGKWRKQARS